MREGWFSDFTPSSFLIELLLNKLYYLNWSPLVHSLDDHINRPVVIMTDFPERHEFLSTESTTVV